MLWVIVTWVIDLRAWPLQSTAHRRTTRTLLLCRDTAGLKHPLQTRGEGWCNMSKGEVRDYGGGAGGVPHRLVSMSVTTLRVQTQRIRILPSR